MSIRSSLYSVWTKSMQGTTGTFEQWDSAKSINSTGRWLPRASASQRTICFGNLTIFFVSDCTALGRTGDTQSVGIIQLEGNNGRFTHTQGVWSAG